MLKRKYRIPWIEELQSHRYGTAVRARLILAIMRHTGMERSRVQALLEGRYISSPFIDALAAYHLELPDPFALHACKGCGWTMPDCAFRRDIRGELLCPVCAGTTTRLEPKPNHYQK